MDDRAVDSSGWDGDRAMSACSSAADYRSICAGEHSAGTPDERQHWALPHHYVGKGPNADGVRAALSRLPQTQDLENRERAQSHLDGHMNEISGDQQKAKPPRDDLYRIAPMGRGYELRYERDGGMPTMAGHFAVFDTPTEIRSSWEGNFVERIAKGAFKKTIQERRDRVRALFQHGQDPQIGDKVLGPITELREDDTGAYYEIDLLDTSYNRDLIPGLEAGLYGASFRFRVIAQEIKEDPGPSIANPRGLQERTVREVELMEFGPVTFPAYAAATAGLRSMTDEYSFARLAHDPDRLRELVEYLLTVTRAGDDGEHRNEEAPSEGAAGTALRTQGRQTPVRTGAPPDYLERRGKQWTLTSSHPRSNWRLG